MTDLRRGSPDGTDRIVNVEQIRFRDGVLDVTPGPTNLTATMWGSHLLVSGEAAVTDGPHVQVRAGYSAADVLDNGKAHVRVPFETFGSSVEIVDVTGMLGAGAWIETNSYDGRVYGSSQGDVVNVMGSYKNWVEAGDGDDVIVATSGQNRLGGGAGNDRITGGSGSDTLVGGRGNDILSGGMGNDVAFFSGNRGDYDLVSREGRLRWSTCARIVPTEPTSSSRSSSFGSGTGHSLWPSSGPPIMPSRP